MKMVIEQDDGTFLDPRSGRRYTSKEVARLQQSEGADQPDTESAQPAPRATSPVQASSMGGNFGSGVGHSLKSTYLGLKQLATYVTGDPEAREAVNQEIANMEEAYGPALNTTSGKIGNVVGTVGQFFVPGAILGRIAKAAPQVVNVASKIFGTAGGVRRAATTAGAFEGAQPIEPGTTNTDDFVVQKGARALGGAAVGAGVGAVANKLTRAATPQAPSLAGIEQEAKRVGFTGKAELTPAQRTGDPDLQQLEEGFASSHGSQKLMRDRRNAQHDVLNNATSKALGYPKMAPTENAFGMARENANLAYEPIAKIPKMSPDVPYWDALTTFAKKQATKATGSTDAANVANRLKKGSGKMTGQDFLEELQGVRDMAFGASKKGDTATAGQLKDLAGIMENFLDRRLTKLSTQKGNLITSDTLKNYQQARTQHSIIHSLEKATDPALGKVNPNKILKEQFSRQRPGSTASPTTQALREITDIARVMRKTMPYIGSSGTAERLGGQRMVEAELNPMASIRMAGPMLRNYLAARNYLRNGGQPGILGSRLSPGQNAFIRRMLPAEVIGGGEAMLD